MEIFFIGPNGRRIIFLDIGNVLYLQSYGKFSLSVVDFPGSDIFRNYETAYNLSTKHYDSGSVLISDSGYYALESNASDVYVMMGTPQEISGNDNSYYMSDYYFIPNTVVGLSIDNLFKKYLAISRPNDGVNNIGLPLLSDLLNNSYWDFDGKFFEVYIFNNSARTPQGASIEFLGSPGVILFGDNFVQGVKTSDLKSTGQSAVFRMRKKDNTEFQFIRMS